MKMGRIFKKNFFQFFRQRYVLILQKLFFYEYHKFPQKITIFWSKIGYRTFNLNNETMNYFI